MLYTEIELTKSWEGFAVKPKRRGRGAMIARFLKGSYLYFFFAIVTSMLHTVFNSLNPQVIRAMVDSIIGTEPFELPDILLNLIESVGGRDYLREHLLWVVAAILLIALCAGLFTYLSRWCTAKGAEGFTLRIREQLFSHIQRLPYQWHVKNRTGDIIQRCTSDVEVMRNFVTGQLLEIVRIVFLVVFAMSIMFSMDRKLTWIALAFMPVVVAYSFFFGGKIHDLFREADESEGDLSAAVQENLTGVRVVRAFGREKYEIERFDEKNERFANKWLDLSYIMGTYWGVGDLFTGLQIMVILVMGTIECVSGNISLGTFMAFISYNSTLVWPIRSLGRVLSEMSKAGVSIDRINYILEEKEEQDDPAGLTPDLRGNIVFENVNFAYEGQLPLLKNVSFTIPAGSTFAILGGTGSGKSTLMHLLDRLYELPEEGGRITVGGVDIRDIKLSHLRKNIGMVLQEPFLFSRTIRENVSAAQPGADLSEVRRATSIASVDDAISSMTEGYDTVVGERGVTLSGGQKQRVAIARMLMQKAPVMIFDDSLSAVDSETDAKIRQALNENLGGSTVILISHRITTLMNADCILVLSGGEIAQIGTHKELIRQPGIYQDIYNIQTAQDDQALLAKEEV